MSGNTHSSPRWALIAVGAVVLIATLLKVWSASTWSLLADEAYYWVWSQRLDWGYFDQPPLIAWSIAGSRTLFGDGELALRSGAILSGLIGSAALATVARDRLLIWLWWIGVPPLLWLTEFATPDALLLMFWSLTLVGAVRGGRWWLLAGVAAGCAFLSKYSGAAVLPLCLLAVGPREWRKPWPWIAVVLFLATITPNLWWNANNDWISFRFQLNEGLTHHAPPGLFGPLRVVGDQFLVLTPILALVLGIWSVSGILQGWRSREESEAGRRAVRIAWMTTFPLLAFFFLAATGGPPEAHWPAPAYLGFGLGLSYATWTLRRWALIGLSVGAFGSALLALHTVRPWLPLSDDPGVRLTEGPLLAFGVKDTLKDSADSDAPVFTERYQEASLIHYYAGIDARRMSGCGRPDQYDLWASEPPSTVWMVRPKRVGYQLCTDADYPNRDDVLRVDALDRFDRIAGRWQIIRVWSQ